MSYRDRLDSLKNDKHIFQPKDRAEEIHQDMMNAFADGSVFGEVMAEAISATVGKAIEKFGIDNLVSDNIERFKSHIAEAVTDYVKSDDFVRGFSETTAQKEAAREQGAEHNSSQQRGQEMGV
ncbi:MAG: hypothetical protein MJA28_12000 [Gammaproteobacteria bacterium]|nr:hypothetical protein [Gammaproteobacteria bacterium]